MATISNVDLWNRIRDAFPNFASHTAKGTKDMFTSAGFEQMKNMNLEALNQFWDLSIRVFLQVVNIAQAKDPLAEADFGEVYEQARGGYIQRLAIQPMKPISPMYKGLKNGASVDPFKVRKPVTTERFFKQNFDYQNLITMPDEFQMKQIFISEFGMSEFMGGLFEQMENAYKIQKYANKLEAINAGLNSTDFPLKDTQRYSTALSDTPTETELVDLILLMKNVLSAMTIGAASSAFNAMSFQTLQDKSRLRILVRPQFRNEISVLVARNSYNASNLDLDVPMIDVEHFGGLKPYKEKALTTPLYEVYDSFGAVIGYNENAGQSAVTVKEDAVFWEDPNKDVIAVIADKGWLFESIQNPYSLKPIYNPAGLYQNYWASAPNNAILIDALYNVAVIMKA